MSDALCLGPDCGRCLKSCPGDVIGHWDRDWSACDRFRSPQGFAQLTEHLGEIFDETDTGKKLDLVRSEKSFNLWQSILRGAGVVTGCRRCQDVCPIGADYELMINDALDDIAEDTLEKTERLLQMRAAEEAGKLPNTYEAQNRWIGKLGSDGKNRKTDP